MRKLTLLLIAIGFTGLALHGCARKSNAPEIEDPLLMTNKPFEYAPVESKNAATVVTQDGRITVTKIGTMVDEDAYNDKRSIFILVDLKTGKEFIGMTGVGISETGMHSSGKSSATDER